MEYLSNTKTLFRTENPFQTQRHCMFRTENPFQTQSRCSKLKISFRHKDTFEVPSELTVSTGADGTNDEVLTACHSFLILHCLLVLQSLWVHNKALLFVLLSFVFVYPSCLFFF